MKSKASRGGRRGPRRLTDAPASLVPPPGLPTGIDALDRMTGGLPLGAISTLCALPSMGSTALALLIALENVRRRRKVVYVSLDSGRRTLVMRLIGLIAGRNPLDLRHGGAAARRDPEVWDGAARLGEVPLWLHTEPRLTIDVLEERLSRGPDAPSLVVVDPVTLVEIADDRPEPNARQQDRWQALAELAHSSGSAWLWVAAAAPAGTPVEDRPDERITLQDLPPGLVQASDLCMAVHRPAYHDLKADRTEAALTVLWNQAGPVGSVDLRWSPDLASFSS